jgi:hypothetical protein
MSDDRPRWRDIPDDEAEGYQTDPVRKLAGPAIGLIVVAALGLLGNFLAFAVMRSVVRDDTKKAPPAGMTKDEKEAWERGRDAAPLLDACLMGIPTLAVYGLALTGGIVMQQGRARGLAITGAILAMVPCGPGFLLGLPIGIWALIVLFKPEVVREFERRKRRSQRRY